jgi:hypothetical protein
MTAPQQNGRQRHEIRIGLWGASGAGKTTFLGALPLATDQARHDRVRWQLTSRDDGALSYLVQHSGTLANEHRFPAGTDGSVPLNWTFIGRRRADGGHRMPAGGGVASATAPTVVEFDLELLDVAGRLLSDGIFFDPAGPGEEPDDLDFDLPDPTAPTAQLVALEQLVSHLTQCQGILYLFDPVGEDESRDSFRHFNAMIRRIYANVLKAGRLHGTHLPHHLAVCVTKFDDPVVLRGALRPEELEQMRGAKPPFKISRDVALGYFNQLCQEPDHGVRFVRDAINACFAADRVNYYATSSIGFWLGPEGRFEPDDFGNVLDNGRLARIRGQVNPMNVLEPLVWLISRIRDAQRRGEQL